MSRSQHPAQHPAVLRLNLPPELSRTMFIYAAIFIVAALVFGGLAWTFVQASGAPPTAKIGLIAPFEGEYRATGYEVLFAAKLALQERNRGEGLRGYRVELVALNDFNDPAEARRQAQALAADPDLVGVVGHQTSAATAAALPVYQAANLAVVIPWSVDATLLRQGERGAVSVAPSLQETEAGLQTFIEEMGLSSVATLADPAGAVALPADTQAFLLDADAVTAGLILQSLPSAALELPRFGRVDVGNRQLPQVAGAAAEGLIFVSPAPAAKDAPGAAQFSADYQALAGLPPGPRAALAYDATHLLLDSIEETMQNQMKWYNGNTVRTAVQQNLNSSQRSGISGAIAFNEAGHRHNAPLWIYQISQIGYPGTLLRP